MAETSMASQSKFIQCPYHIKNAKSIGFYQCQGSIDHEPNKHILPPDGPGSDKTKTVGQWFPTFEEAYQAYKANIT
jgi:hypothetical protein